MSTQPARVATAGNLPDQLGESGPRSFLFCAGCASEFSAHRGDYWYLPDDAELVCGCGEPLRLVRRLRVLVAA